MTPVNVNRYTVTRSAAPQISVAKPTFAVSRNESGGVVLARTSINNVVARQTQTVTVSQPVVRIITAGTQGPAGADGSSTFSAVAGEDLSALRLVRADPASGTIFYADKDSVSDGSTILGMTVTAATAGTPVTILPAGLHADSNWTWNASGDPTLFLWDDGAIVQGEPSGSVTVRAGTVVSQTQALIRIHQPIVR